MSALLETSDNSERPSEDIFIEASVPKNKPDQPCDVILVVEDDKQFKAHRQVLSEASPFFEKLLNSKMKESKEGIVRLEMFSESVMAATLEFVYTGHIQILTEKNARDLILSGDYLFLQNLKTLAEGVLIDELNVFNCFSNYYFSEKYQCACEELFSKTRKFILANFRAVYSVNRTEVLNMSSSEIEMLISSDEINVSAEEEVFNIILSWIDHDKIKRKKYFAELFRHVRLVYVSRDFLCSDVVTNDLVTDNEGCFCRVKGAMKLCESRDFSNIHRYIYPYNLFAKPRSSLETSIIVIKKKEDILCYFPHEDKWCRLGTSSDIPSSHAFTHIFGFVSCRGKLNSVMESSDSRPATWNTPWSFQRQLARYDPFSDKWMLLPYTGKKYRHLEQIFVTKQDELYALVSQPCMDGGLSKVTSQLIGRWGKFKFVYFITKYKHESNSWEDISSFDHQGRYDFCIVSTDNFIYFIGGEEWVNGARRKARTDVDRYDLRKNQWSKVADIHEGRGTCGWGAVVDEKIFIVHFGQIDTNFLSQMFLWQTFQCQVYDETTNEWQVIASPKCGVLERFKNLLGVDGKLYTVIQNKEDIKVECYDPVQDKWNLKTKITIPRPGDERGLINTCSMGIYKALLADHQLERFIPLDISGSPDSLAGPDSLSSPDSLAVPDSLPNPDSLDSLAGPTNTPSTSSGEWKCFIM